MAALLSYQICIGLGVRYRQKVFLDGCIGLRLTAYVQDSLEFVSRWSKKKTQSVNAGLCGMYDIKVDVSSKEELGSKVAFVVHASISQVANCG